MSRPYRLQAEYCFYHITSRGNNRKNIFHSDKDRYKFLDYLLQAKEKFLFNLYAYTLMDNHYHLLIETINANLSKIMHIINGSYCSYHNRAHKQVGHLFQGRFKSIVVDKDAYFLTLSAYIHMNPVRAKIVSSPGAYKWSSYKAYIQKKTDGYVDIDKIRSVLGDNLIRYSDFVLGYADTEGKSIFNDLYAGFILGSSNFIKDNLKTLKTQNCDYSKDISYKNELEGSPSAELIVNNIDRIYQKHPRQLVTNKKKVINKRKIGMYLLKRLTPMTSHEIGKLYGVSFSAVSKASSSVEKELHINKRLYAHLNSIISKFKG